MIDYSIINDSIVFYEKNGFARIEAPWTVSKHISSITKPEDKIDYELVHNGKVLVASAEQSFLYLYLKNFLPKGQFQAVTPCFRDEPFDSTHSKYFMKNELIITDDVNEDHLDLLVTICRDFFEQKIDDAVEIHKTLDGYDLICDGIELGSYGIRSCYFLDWIYGTGVAEPRLSNLIKYKNGLSHRNNYQRGIRGSF